MEDRSDFKEMDVLSRRAFLGSLLSVGVAISALPALGIEIDHDADLRSQLGKWYFYNGVVRDNHKMIMAGPYMFKLVTDTGII